MYDGKYWSVEDCRWVDCPEGEVEAAVPAQREDESTVEPVEAAVPG